MPKSAAKNIAKQQQEVLTPDEFYKAKLIFHIDPEPEVTLSVKMTEGVRDEMRAFCRKYNIQQQKFVTEAIKEVLYRLKREMEASEELETARKQARGEVA